MEEVGSGGRVERKQQCARWNTGRGNKRQEILQFVCRLCDVQKAARRSTASASSSTRHLNSNSAA